MKKKIVLFVLITILITALSTLYAGAEGLPDLTKVQNVCVYNVENDRVLYEKNEADKIHPASTAKIMTGIIAVEFYKDRYAELITVTEEALGNFKGKSINLKVGEIVSVENLVYATIIGGANDAANVLAYEISGSHEIFVGNMNHKAMELGMTNTHYTNAYGYTDTSMYTTAEDTAKLAKYAYFVQDYMDICSMTRYVFEATNMAKTRYIYNSNYLIATNIESKYRNKEAVGMNAGSTVEGGHVVVTSVSKNGMTNIFVLMGGAYDDENIYSYYAVNEMIDWAYDSFEYKKILDSGEMVCEIDVALSGQVDYVVLSPERTVEYFLPVSVDVEKDIKRKVTLINDTLEAPFDAGLVVGKMTLTYEDEVIAEVDLITKNSVSRNSFLYLLARIRSFTNSPKFKVTMVCVIVALVLYFAFWVYNKTRSKQYRYKYHGQRRR